MAKPKTASTKGSISVKTLCEMTGTKYYVHNNEINIAGTRVVRVFNEQDELVGDMNFDEA